VTVFTIGHSTRSADQFLDLLRGARVERVWDIRTFPGSRRYPHFNAERLAQELPAQGIVYEHRPELGGRRRPSTDGSPTAWRNEGFRGYAEYMQTPEFRTALDHLIAASGEMPTAMMCSEAVPWRCHRNLVSDALVARGIEVHHIMDGKIAPHTLTSFAVVRDGEVYYPPNELQAELDLNQKSKADSSSRSLPSSEAKGSSE
jgi:uncharacterized protein (DUF488 family)